MKANPEFDRQQPALVRPRKQNQVLSTGMGLFEPPISSVPRIRPTIQPASSQGARLIYDHSNRFLHAAITNLQNFFPDLFAQLNKYSVDIMISEQDLGTGTLGSTYCMISASHDKYDIIPLRKENKKEGEPDTWWRKNHVYGGQIIPRAGYPMPTFKISTVFVKISPANILTALRGNTTTTYSITDRPAERKYHATLAHELLGHAEYSLSHPDLTMIWNALYKKMTDRNGPGHELFNVDGVNADRIGNQVYDTYPSISKDPRFIHF